MDALDPSFDFVLLYVGRLIGVLLVCAASLSEGPETRNCSAVIILSSGATGGCLISGRGAGSLFALFMRFVSAVLVVSTTVRSLISVEPDCDGCTPGRGWVR